MRYLMWGGGLALLALASCAPSPAPSSASAPKNPAHAIIVTVRPVLPGDTRAAALLRDSRDTTPTPAGTTEYILRTEDGGTLAVVQAADPALRPGAAVTVGRGERTTLVLR